MPSQEITGDREAVTGESTCQPASVVKSTFPGVPVGLISRRDIQEKIEALQDLAWIENDEGKKVRLIGRIKKAFISLCRKSFLIIDHSTKRRYAYKLGNFIYEARNRLRRSNCFGAWLKFIGFPRKEADRLIQIYDRYGVRLSQFGYLGLEKLWIASQLDDCVGFVERHEEAIAAQTEDELKQRVQEEALEYEVKPTVWLLDGDEDQVEELSRMLPSSRCKHKKVVMQFVPDLPKITCEAIISSNPDLLIVNAFPFSGLRPQFADGIDIVQRLRGKSDIPVIFYRTDMSIERSSRKMWSRLIDAGPLAFLRTPFTLKEVLTTVNSALRVVHAEIQERRAYGVLEKLVALRTEQLTAANKQLKDEVQARKSAEENAIESQQRLQAVFDCAVDAIFIKNTMLAYRMVNPALAVLLGHEESGILGKTDAAFFDQAAAEHFKEVEQRVLQGETVEEQYSRLVNGAEMTFLDSRVPLRDGSGKVVGICGFSRDITERQRISPELFTSNHEYSSQAMRACLKQARKAAGSDSTVLMLGESGSGKDHLARYIHDHSKRAGGLYFSINCAAVAPELAESELFGHERGAFTGARSRKRGLLELAEGGTLLLNEIGELSLHQQAKLLTFLETKKFTRVGGEREVDVNARLMAATNRDLEDAVKDGSFRKDLFYRLNVLPITVPPLRERRSDIPMLVQEFVHDLCEEMQLTEQPIITPSTMKAFQAYQWPGNVRELRNVLERALILSGGARVDIASLGSEPEIYSPGKELDQTTAHGPLLSVPDSLPLIARPHGDMGRRPIDPGRDVLRTLKQQYVIDGKWSIEQLAKAMHLHRSTLSKWFKKHGLIEPTRLPQEKAKV